LRQELRPGSSYQLLDEKTVLWALKIKQKIVSELLHSWHVSITSTEKNKDLNDVARARSPA